MAVDVESLKCENAWVTGDGIMFEGRYYSCKRAIREGWFNGSFKELPWQVQVQQNPEQLEAPRIYIAGSEPGDEDLCYEVRRSSQALEELELYQECFRQLQAERKRYKSRLVKSY